jgi:isoprenylcysteine carboxyl methyltransferase (ICMT) family protein YpbQ
VFETYNLPKRASGKITFKFSLTVLTVLHVACVFGAAIETWRGPAQISAALAWSGVSLYLVALVLRNWAKSTLANHWSLQIEILPSHQIVRDGPYKYVRHPAYTAIMLEVIAIPLACSAFNTLVLVSLPYIVFLIIRSHVEEKALLVAAAEDYQKFQNAIPRFMPNPLTLLRNRKAG